LRTLTDETYEISLSKTCCAESHERLHVLSHRSLCTLSPASCIHNCILYNNKLMRILCRLLEYFIILYCVQTQTTNSVTDKMSRGVAIQNNAKGGRLPRGIWCPCHSWRGREVHGEKSDTFFVIMMRFGTYTVSQKGTSILLSITLANIAINLQQSIYYIAPTP